VRVISWLAATNDSAIINTWLPLVAPLTHSPSPPPEDVCESELSADALDESEPSSLLVLASSFVDDCSSSDELDSAGADDESSLVDVALVWGADELLFPCDEGAGLEVVAELVVVGAVDVAVKVDAAWLEPALFVPEVSVVLEPGLVSVPGVAGSEEQANDRASTVKWLSERFMLTVIHLGTSFAERRFCRPPEVNPFARKYFAQQ
jgi:hypothetical protein